MGDTSATALATILSKTMITNLECAAARECLLWCQCPLTCYADFLTPPPPPLARSLRGNAIRGKGASALAAILKETKITGLKCADRPRVFTFLSVPVDRLALPPFPLRPSLAVSDTTQSEPRV